MEFLLLDICQAIRTTTRKRVLIWHDRRRYDHRTASIYDIEDADALIDYLVRSYRANGLNRDGKESLTGYFLFDDYTDLKGVFQEVRE